MNLQRNKRCAIGLALSLSILATAASGLSAVPANAQTAQASQGNQAYTLSPGDQMTVVVSGHTDYGATVTVLPDGTIQYPSVGTVHVAGMTMKRLTEVLTKGLGRDLNDPQVTIILTATLPQTVSVIGAVKTPGLYNYKTGWSVLDALASAGGPAQDPSLTTLMLVKDSGRTTVPVDTVGLMAGIAADNVQVEPGDVILVEAKDPSLIQVTVSGEVAKPGTYSIPSTGVNAVQVLSQAGGATDKAQLSKTVITHNSVARTVDMRGITIDSAGNDPNDIVYPGDAVSVPTNGHKIAVIGDVNAPGVYTVPDGGSLYLTTAIALAGGPNTDAKKRDTTVLRESDNGTKPLSFPVDLDRVLKGDPKVADMALEPGDIVYVPGKGDGGGLRQALQAVPLVGLMLK